MNLPRSEINTVLDAHPFPLVFITVSGAHLYGFPSADSDFDLRGVHLLPLAEVLSLHPKRETVEASRVENGVEADFVTHDAAKFFGLMLKKNGYVLEQLYSPLVIRTSAAHEELKALGRGCITRFHAHHYLGFSETQWGLFGKEEPPRVKPLLYVYRVLLTGIHLMQTGEVQANLVELNEKFRLPHVRELIQRKTTGAEKGVLPAADMAFHEGEYRRLRGGLEAAMSASHLPEGPSAGGGLSDLLVRLRLEGR